MSLSIVNPSNFHSLFFDRNHDKVSSGKPISLAVADMRFCCLYAVISADSLAVTNLRSRGEGLTFTDDFMFCKIMQSNPDLCRELTELIIGRKTGEIIWINKQAPIEITADGRGVRFDIYMEERIHDTAGAG